MFVIANNNKLFSISLLRLHRLIMSNYIVRQSIKNSKEIGIIRKCSSCKWFFFWVCGFKITFGTPCTFGTRIRACIWADPATFLLETTKYVLIRCCYSDSGSSLLYTRSFWLVLPRLWSIDPEVSYQERWLTSRNTTQNYLVSLTLRSDSREFKG